MGMGMITAGDPMSAGEGSDGEMERSGFVAVKSWVGAAGGSR